MSSGRTLIDKLITDGFISVKFFRVGDCYMNISKGRHFRVFLYRWWR